jgi:hypothetical protein
MKRILTVAVLSLLLLYLCDYLLITYRIAKARDPFGVVKIEPYYAVRQKNGKDELYFLPPETQVCVQSLFPHFGHSPCWYVNRKKVERIPI